MTDFMAFLDKCQKEIASWPEWKTRNAEYLFETKGEDKYDD